MSNSVLADQKITDDWFGLDGLAGVVCVVVLTAWLDAVIESWDGWSNAMFLRSW